MFFYGKAKEIGERFGNTIGNAVGMAVGSCEGITKRIPEGMEAGKEQGLSAEDIDVDISTQIKSMGKLEVLAASVALTDFQEIGDDYKAIYVYKADAIFTVDFGKTNFDETGAGVKITFKELPLVEWNIDEEATERVAKWQKHFYSGKTEEGYRAYINSRANIDENSTDAIRNYDVLQLLAQEAAKTRVEALVKAIRGQDIEVEISFIEGDNP